MPTRQAIGLVLGLDAEGYPKVEPKPPPDLPVFACVAAGDGTLAFTDQGYAVGDGMYLVTVQHLLGHSSITLTQRYAHLSPGAEAEAVRLLHPGGQSIRIGSTETQGASEEAP